MAPLPKCNKIIYYFSGAQKVFVCGPFSILLGPVYSISGAHLISVHLDRSNLQITITIIPTKLFSKQNILF